MPPYYLYRQKNIAGNFENVGYAKNKKECFDKILLMDSPAFNKAEPTPPAIPKTRLCCFNSIYPKL